MNLNKRKQFFYFYMYKKSIIFLWALCTAISVYGSKNLGGDDVKQAVDLGLSVKWASCNVGASSSEGIGGYYAWGETELKSDYTEETYKYYVNGKYTSIGSTICGTHYDVAHVKWGGKWRMPTIDELKELKEKCTWTWTTQNGVKGMRVTGPNGHSIFLPAAGSRYGSGVDRTGDYGFYWSGSLNEDNGGSAWDFYCYNSGDYDWHYGGRCYGFQVRPVLEENPNQDHDVHGEEQTVDLGLSVKWASCNVGASTPEGTGGYYAWGETEEKSKYDRDTYKYYADGKYTNIGSSICGTQYDVAHVKWGEKWRMPMLDELKELVEKCTWTWTTQNGVKGMKVTGPNGHSIFLPAVGYRDGNDVLSTGISGYYWSGSLNEDNGGNVWTLGFRNGGSHYWYYFGRYYGFPVRPVSE